MPRKQQEEVSGGGEKIEQQRKERLPYGDMFPAIERTISRWNDRRKRLRREKL